MPSATGRAPGRSSYAAEDCWIGATGTLGDVCLRPRTRSSTPNNRHHRIRPKTPVMDRIERAAQLPSRLPAPGRRTSCSLSSEAPEGRLLGTAHMHGAQGHHITARCHRQPPDLTLLTRLEPLERERPETTTGLLAPHRGAMPAIVGGLESRQEDGRSRVHGRGEARWARVGDVAPRDAVRRGDGEDVTVPGPDRDEPIASGFHGDDACVWSERGRLPRSLVAGPGDETLFAVFAVLAPPSEAGDDQAPIVRSHRVGHEGHPVGQRQ